MSKSNAEVKGLWKNSNHKNNKKAGRKNHWTSCSFPQKTHETNPQLGNNFTTELIKYFKKIQVKYLLC